RVLVPLARQHRVGGGLGHGPRPVDVGEALAQVDRAGPHGQRGHLGEDRRPHTGEALAQQWSTHSDSLIWWHAHRPVPDPGQLPARCQPGPGPRGPGRGGQPGRRAGGVPRGHPDPVRLRSAAGRGGGGRGVRRRPGPGGRRRRGGGAVEGGSGAARARAAADAGVALVAGIFPPAPDGRVYNTAVTFGADGELVAAYRKLHLFDAFGTLESDLVAPGADVVVTKLAGLSVG